MKRILSAGVCLAILSVAAQAADLPSRNMKPSAPVITTSAYNWSGFYAGVNVGYAWSNADKAQSVGNPAALAFVNAGAFPPGFNAKKSGFIGGGQLGYNYQIGQFVIGAETDLQYLGTKKTATVLLPTGTYGSFKQDSSYLGTVRARLGFTPIDRLLVYGTGGLAYGSTGGSASLVAPTFAGAPQWYGSKSATKVGWTLGGGVEYALTNNITTKLEYLYYDLGKNDVAMAGINAAGVGSGVLPAVKAESKGSIVRAGLNYKF